MGFFYWLGLGFAWILICKLLGFNEVFANWLVFFFFGGKRWHFLDRKCEILFLKDIVFWGLFDVWIGIIQAIVRSDSNYDWYWSVILFKLSGNCTFESIVFASCALVIEVCWILVMGSSVLGVLECSFECWN